jgi:hypothetical protein
VYDEQHLRGLLPLHVFVEIGVKSSDLLLIGSNRQQSFWLIDDNDVLVLENDLDSTTW